MIFVTVGTHEQQFDRLIKYVDELKGKDIIKEDVIIQSGFSTYKPKYCKWSKLFPYNEMLDFIKDASIVITHGGPSSFIMPLQIGKIPIVVPRQKKFDEHVNDHQIDFCNIVKHRQGNIIVIDDIKELDNNILNYRSNVRNMPSSLKSNNSRFNNQLSSIVDNLFLER